MSQGSFDLGGNQEQSKWYNGESNFITNLEENGRYYDADFNFDYLIWENFNSEFIQSDHSLTLRLEKGIGLYGDGIQFIKSAYIDNKFIFYGIYNEYDETTNDKSFKIFEYTRSNNENLPLYITLLLLLTCAKEDSQAPNTPPTQIVKQYTLTASAGEGGSVSGGGTFASGTQVSLTATPNARI